ncbi:MAG: aminotransferase class III-fold pyridoxal phosphate-dependent enzyme, partial [Deltaproteobacteria bacterium]|nr:aminotransferase class III-fold pyridoxal phosphate-dependent enzyme [Deltaproteobacteria bacterium]
AGLAALKVIVEEGILENCQKASAYLVKRLDGLKKDFSFIKEIRGKGLIIGMELADGIKGGDIVKDCLERGLLINCVGDKTLRFIPALIVGEKEIDEMIGVLAESFRNLA